MLRACLLLLMLLSSQLTAEPGTLKVGISPDYEPLAFERNSLLVGIEVDNAREIGRLIGRRVEFVDMPFEQLIPSLEIGRVDIVMSGFTITEKRLESVDFSEPFMSIGQMAIVRTADVVKMSHPDAMQTPGLRIAVKPDTTGQAFVDQAYPEALIQNFPDNERAFNALRKNVSDVYVHDAPTSWNLWKDGQNKDLFSLARPLTIEELAWAVRKGNSWLLDEINSALEQMRSSGKLVEIQNKWITVTDVSGAGSNQGE